MVNSFLNNYFGFNRQQRNGLMVLICLSFLLFVIRITYPFFISPPSIEVLNLPTVSLDDLPVQPTSGAAELFVFDPNTATTEQLVRLGLKEKTAATLVKYRKRHPFTKKEDLQKVFGISDRLYNELSPYILIGPAKKTRTARSTKKTPVTAQGKKLELNTADSTQLETLKGIGPAFARRIIKYRNMLGGFTGKEQLLEVYGLTEEKYRLIENEVEVNPSLITRINVNTDDFKVVNRHPYISYELTKKIFDARRKAPLTTSSFRELVGDEPLCNKLQPYLNF
jgi:competence protein ComEA